MSPPGSVNVARYAQLLADREQELLALLHRTAESIDAAPGPGEVQDFKDAAIEESMARVDDAQAALAARELDAVQAAIRRVHNGSYGQCLDCGEAIDEQRLLALPATRYCTSCQGARESLQHAIQRGRTA